MLSKLPVCLSFGNLIMTCLWVIAFELILLGNIQVSWISMFVQLPGLGFFIEPFLTLFSFPLQLSSCTCSYSMVSQRPQMLSLLFLILPPHSTWPTFNDLLFSSSFFLYHWVHLRHFSACHCILLLKDFDWFFYICIYF